MEKTGYIYVSIVKRKGEPMLKCSGNKNKFFPLTKRGCIDSGRYIYSTGVESFLCSSSVDFPQEMKKGFRYDVQELIAQGFREEMEKVTAPRRSAVLKLLEWGKNSKEFLATLSKEEKDAFDIIVVDTAKEESDNEVSDTQ